MATSAAIGVAATVPVAIAAEPHDPTFELVREYERQWNGWLESEAYQCWASTKSSDPMWARYEAEADALAERTYKPLETRLDSDEGLPPVTTQAGAVGCLAYVLERMNGCCPTAGDENVLRAVHAFVGRSAPNA